MDKLELPGWFKVIIFMPSYLICLAVVTLSFDKTIFDLVFSKVSSDGTNFMLVVGQLIYEPPYRYLLTLRVFVEALTLLAFLFVLKKLVDPAISTIFQSLNTFDAKAFLSGVGLSGIMITLPVLILWQCDYIILQDVIFPIKEIIYFIFIYAGVALMEEVIFRGYMLTRLFESTGAFWAITVSSFIFSILHSANDSFSWIAFGNLFLFGTVLSLLFLQHLNIWLIIGVHFAWNFVQGNIWGFNVSGKENTSIMQWQYIEAGHWTGGSFGLEGSWLTSLILVIMTLLLITSQLRISHNIKARRNMENLN